MSYGIAQTSAVPVSCNCAKGSVSSGRQLLVILMCITLTAAVFFSLDVTTYEDQMHSALHCK